MDGLTNLKYNLESTKDIVVENLDKLLERGEKIGLLVKKTDNMVDLSKGLKTQATSLKRQMWWRNAKLYVAIGIGLALLIYIILVIACGWKVECGKKSWADILNVLCSFVGVLVIVF